MNDIVGGGMWATSESDTRGFLCECLGVSKLSGLPLIYSSGPFSTSKNIRYKAEKTMRRSNSANTLESLWWRYAFPSLIKFLGIFQPFSDEDPILVESNKRTHGSENFSD